MPPAMASGKKLINDPNDVVVEAIEGLVETYPNLTYLDGVPEIKVVLRADVCQSTYDKVAVISGGGSGHEPAHAGYVGPGMLTAAVCGEVFASPSVAAVLAAIRAVTGASGCLLIVKNYTGDRLNFGLAAEQAKAEGFKVEVVIVGDDSALPPPLGFAGRRGLAGTLFVHKVAGAAAAAGLSLAEVAAEARKIAQNVGTMGVALTVCTIPGQSTSDRLGPGKMELGLGIHGEPGIEQCDVKSVDKVVSHILHKLLSPETEFVSIHRGSTVALMVNGLGGTPMMELTIAAGKAVAHLQVEYGLAVERVYTGSFMTSLDMAGMSLSVLKVDDSVLSRLDAPTSAPAWPVGVSGKYPHTLGSESTILSLHRVLSTGPSAKGLGLTGPRPPTTLPVALPQARKTSVAPSRPVELTDEGKVLEVAIEAGAEALLGLKDYLNELDRKTGDGDCGSTMYTGASAVLRDLKEHYPLNDPAATIGEVGSSIRRSMGGTSGVIYDIFCKAVHAQLVEGPEVVTPQKWSTAFAVALAAVSTYGGASSGQRTLLDSLLPASKALQEALAEGRDPVQAFLVAADAAMAGAEATKGMIAVAGRSMYVPKDLVASVPDPGAVAAATWLKAAASAVADLTTTSVHCALSLTN